ncbi:MAG: hypothetical protein INR69_07775 [Mucilaginibacter polytrichastri]|nr:hypothetical protein [Mucilaginibacter polytrichastri]
MRFIFNIIVLFLCICHIAGAQERINPAKGLSVDYSGDTLVFKRVKDKQIAFCLPVKEGSAFHYLEFSPSGNYLVTSGKGPATHLYLMKNDTAILVRSWPALTEESVFDQTEKSVFLLHTRSLLKTQLYACATEPGEQYARVILPFRAHDLSIDASGSRLALCEGANIRTYHAATLRKQKVYRQRTPQRLLAFNPRIADELAGVDERNHIRIINLEKDSLITEIDGHGAAITWMKYDPAGTLLASLDKQGNLSTWMPSVKECIAQFEHVGGVPVFGEDGTLHLSPRGKSKPDMVGFKKTARSEKGKNHSYFLETSSLRHTLELPAGWLC